MQSTVRGSVLGVALVLIGLTAAAAEEPRNDALHALLTPSAGNKACYARSYNAAHLRAHPRQRVTAMKFLLVVEAYDPPSSKVDRPEDRFYYTFAMSVMRRGDKRVLTTGGGCSSGEAILCAVDCDGGSVALDKMPPAGSLIVRLNEHGIRMFHDCDGEEGVLVNAGADDKVFRLDKVAAEACRSLEEEQ